MRVRPSSSARFRRAGVVGASLAVALACAAVVAGAGAPDPPTVAAALESDDARVRRAAASAAGWIDRAAHPDAAARLAPRLALALDDADPAVPARAAEALRALGPGAVEPLVAAFREPPAGAAREPFARALGELGPVAAAAAPVLLDALVAPGSRWEATRIADALGRLGPAAAPGLLRAIAERPGSREALLRALAVLGPDAGPAAVAPVAAILSGDADARNRFSAALALGAMGGVAAPAAPALLDALRDDDNASVRMYAAQALGSAGQADPAPAVRGLLDALRAGDRRIAARAVSALGALGAPALEPALAALAGDGDPFVREHAASALREMDGAAAAPRVAALVAALDDPAERVRESAALALRGLGRPAVDALLPIAAGTADAARPDGEAAAGPDPALRAWAAVILGRLDPVPVEALPALRAAARSDDGRLREAATWALGKLGPDAAPARPELVAALDDADPVVRRNAAWALGNAGRQAADAAPRLDALRRDDPDAAVREEADEALRKVRGEYAFDPGSRRASGRLLSRAAGGDLDVADAAAAAGAGTAPAIPSVDDVYASGTRAAVLGPSRDPGGADLGGPAPRGGSVAYDFRLTPLGTTPAPSSGAAAGAAAVRGSATVDLDAPAPRWRAALEGDGWAGTLRRDGDRVAWEPLHGEAPAAVETLAEALLVPADLRLDGGGSGGSGNGDDDGDADWIEIPASEAGAAGGAGWTALHRADDALRAQVDLLLWDGAWCPTEVRRQRLGADGRLAGHRLTVLRAEPGPPLPARAFR